MMNDNPPTKGRSVVVPAVIALMFGALGMLIMLYTTRVNGIGLSPDSARYVSTATEFAAGHGFTTYTGEKYVYQSPLYPVILGLTHRGLGIDTVEAARLVNTLVFGAIVGLSTWLVSQWFQSTWGLPLIAGSWALFAPSVYNVAAMAWTEALFILFTLIFFWQMVVYLDKQRWRNFWLCVGAASLAGLTRYVGIVVIATGVWCVFWWSAGTRLMRGRRAVIFGGVVSFLPGCWLVRNWIVSHTLTGKRVPSAITLTTNLRDAMTTALKWFTNSMVPPAETVIVLGWGVVIGLVAGYLFIVFRRTDFRQDGDGMPVRVLLIYSLGYTVLSIISATTTAYDQLDDRLMAPVFLPMMLLCLFMLEFALRRVPLLMKILVWLSLGLWILVVPAMSTMATSIERAKYGASGYASDEWVNNATLRYWEDNLAEANDAALYSNRRAAVYLLLDRVAFDTPRRTYTRSETVQDDLNELYGNWPVTSPAYLIWFDNIPLPYYSVEDLSAIAELTSVAELDDGVIYLISPRE